MDLFGKEVTFLLDPGDERGMILNMMGDRQVGEAVWNGDAKVLRVLPAVKKIDKELKTLISRMNGPSARGTEEDDIEKLVNSYKPSEYWV